MLYTSQLINGWLHRKCEFLLICYFFLLDTVILASDHALDFGPRRLTYVIHRQYLLVLQQLLQLGVAMDGDEWNRQSLRISYPLLYSTFAHLGLCVQKPLGPFLQVLVS